jgi:hypothetical protein
MSYTESTDYLRVNNIEVIHRVYWLVESKQ